MPPAIPEAIAAPAPAPELSGIERARRLWTGRFRGVISTHSRAEPGYPFGSVVPFCLDAGGLPVFLFSHLAQHTQNLEADPRCALTLHEMRGADVSQSTRLTAIGECSRLSAEESIAAGARYFRYFPRGRAYFEALNFHLYRLVPSRFHFNGGFASARWLGTERILPTQGFDEGTEAALIVHLEQTHAGILQAGLRRRRAARHPLRVAGVDPSGLDLGAGDRLRRLHFPRSACSPAEVDALLLETVNHLNTTLGEG